MQQVTSADAQNRFGRLLDMAQREPVAITRHGRTAGYVISPQDMELLLRARADVAVAPVIAASQGPAPGEAITRAATLAAQLRGRATVRMSTEQIMQHTRGE